jgi:hypothetical protein
MDLLLEITGRIPSVPSAQTRADGEKLKAGGPARRTARQKIV